MKITIWSLKGGVGKTSIALNLALTRNCKIITNERYSLLDSILDDKKLLQLQTSEKPPKLKKEDRVIFDMGGTVDKRIIDCLEQSDFVLIPTTANDIDIQGCISTIGELQDHIDESRIVVIVNNTTNINDFEKVKGYIDQITRKCKIFEIKRSRGLVNIFDRKKSIKDLVSENGLNRYNYEKINRQFNDLINFLERIKT